MNTISQQRGSALITLITMTLVLSSVGLFILSSQNTASMGGVTEYLSWRASLIAESGYQFLTSQYKHAPPDGKNSSLHSLHNQTFTLRDGEGDFTLAIFPYYYATTAAHSAGASALTVRFPGAKPAEFVVPTSGALAIRGTDLRYHWYTYTSMSQSGDLYTFSGIPGPGLLETVPSGASVVQVCGPTSTQTVASGSGASLVLDSTAGKVLPLRFGAFGLDSSASGDTNNVYLYQSRNGNILQGISVFGDPTRAFSFTVNPSSRVYAHPVASLNSTGTVGPADSAASSTFSRMAILGFGAAGGGGTGGDATFTEQAEDVKSFKENWTVIEGKARITSGKSSDNKPAITLKGREALLGLNLDTIGIRFNPGALVSYEVQAKVKVDFDEGKDDYYITGLSFRLNSDASHCYGVSFFKAYSDARIMPAAFDKVLESAAVKNGIPHVILWVRDMSNPTSPYQLLEYKPLETSDGIVEAITYYVGKKPVVELRLNDWSTLLVKVDEKFSGTSGARQNHISAYIASASSYPRDTVTWPDQLGDLFTPVAWHASVQPIIDSTITSEDRSPTDPEVGLHGFYDSKNEREQIFDDFSFRAIRSSAGPGGSAPGM